MIHTKIPDQHLFTVRGRSVLFRKTEKSFGALHATERGYFPVSHTGYHSLASFSLCVSDFSHMVSDNFLESLAAEQDRYTNEALHDIVRCASRDMANETACHAILFHAAHAFEYGFFATDALRRQLWQAACEAYRNLFNCPLIRSARKEPGMGLLRSIEADWRTFEALRRCMNGDFAFDRTGSRLAVISRTSYFELPPKPEGEPVTPIPAYTPMLDLGT